MSRFRRYSLRKPICPRCGQSWRWWEGHGRYRAAAHPRRVYDCQDRWHDGAYRARNWRRTNNPLPIPDGRLLLGDPSERSRRRVRRHRQHQSKARR